MRKIFPWILCLLILAGCASPEAASVTTIPATTMATEEPTTAPTETEPQEEHFLLTFAGDCTFGSNPVNRYALYSFENTIGEDWSYPFANVLSYFENDDCTLVNLEGALSETGHRIPKAFNFKGSPDYVNILTENSVEAVSLANNHSMDYGVEGYENTVATLNAAGVPYAETNQSTLLTTERGLTCGIYGTVYYCLVVED